jgi:hypothetical protein
MDAAGEEQLSLDGETGVRKSRMGNRGSPFFCQSRTAPGHPFPRECPCLPWFDRGAEVSKAKCVCGRYP